MPSFSFPAKFSFCQDFGTSQGDFLRAWIDALPSLAPPPAAAPPLVPGELFQRWVKQAAFATLFDAAVENPLGRMANPGSDFLAAHSVFPEPEDFKRLIVRDLGHRSSVDKSTGLWNDAS